MFPVSPLSGARYSGAQPSQRRRPRQPKDDAIRGNWNAATLAHQSRVDDACTCTATLLIKAFVLLIIHGYERWASPVPALSLPPVIHLFCLALSLPSSLRLRLLLLLLLPLHTPSTHTHTHTPVSIKVEHKCMCEINACVNHHLVRIKWSPTTQAIHVQKRALSIQKRRAEHLHG